MLHNSRTVFRSPVWLMFPALAVLLLTGCKEPNPYPVPGSFEWSPETAKVTGKNLRTWVEKAPFAGKWDPYNSGDSKGLVITNTSVIFPYMGTYYADDGYQVHGLSTSTMAFPHYIYTEDTTYYNDPKWGPVAVYAALMYRPDPVWIEDFYIINTSMQSFLGGGPQTGMPPTIKLERSLVMSASDDHRTAIFVVDNPLAGPFLFAFYQQGELLLEVAFHCPRSEQEACLAKLSETASRMGLDIPEWKNATREDLQSNDTTTNRESLFWRSRFATIELKARSGASAAIKVATVGSGFVESKSPIDKTNDQTRVLTKQFDGGIASLSFRLDATKLKRKEFEKKVDGLRYDHYIDGVFLVPASAGDGHEMTGQASIYLGPDGRGQIVSMTYSYPEGDEQAGHEVRALITGIRNGGD